jgi:di/tricarboxylate transporter
MSLYALGVWCGRAFASYLIVLILLILVNRFHVGKALKKSGSWYSMVLVVCVFLLGVASTVSKNSFL